MIFTFSFDDAYASWREAARILSGYGFHGTFNTVLRNVVYRRVDTRPKMFPASNVLTWGELQDIYGMGHEIASHGTRHVDLPNCSPSELWMEIAGSKMVLNEYGLDVDNYACAFNSQSGKIADYALKHYKVFRGNVGVNKLPLDTPVYHAMDGTKAVQYVKDNHKKNEWVVGIWHNIEPYKFEETVAGVKKLSIEVKSVREVYLGETK